MSEERYVVRAVFETLGNREYGPFKIDMAVEVANFFIRNSIIVDVQNWMDHT